jgi:hypothetical protein
MVNFRVNDELSTTLDAPWAELALTREIYGIIQSLNLRPFSKGHDGGVHLAKQRLRSLAGQLSRSPLTMLTSLRVSLLQMFIDRLDDIPPEVVARTLATSLFEALTEENAVRSCDPCVYVGEASDTIRLNQLVIAVGPTIGLGDEFLVARALKERSFDLGGVKLWVSSHNFD